MDHRSNKTICHFKRASYFSGPRAPGRRDNLHTWSAKRIKSANEVAQIINKRTIR